MIQELFENISLFIPLQLPDTVNTISQFKI